MFISYNLFFSFILSFIQNGTGTGDGGGRGNGHPTDNPFYSNIDSMPDIRPRRKSIPLVSELVSISLSFLLILLLLDYKKITVPFFSQLFFTQNEKKKHNLSYHEPWPYYSFFLFLFSLNK